ncbi:MAG: DUF2071 domain-containing protein [Tepidisphaeraceae bacterium]
MPKIFLSAEWRRLCLANFAVPTDVLAPHLPPDCTPDLLDGRAYVSLVAFEFLNARVFGIRWPGFHSFPELNLRAYVRHADGRRGVTFIREFVPQRIVAAMARWTHNEPYVAVPMKCRIEEDDRSIRVEHELRIAGVIRRVACTADKPTWMPTTNSVEHFFKEQEWGFGRSRRGELIGYRVQHPQWTVYRNPTLQLDFNFADVYGEGWRCLNAREPDSIVLAEGSRVTVTTRL